jgi:arabinofuranosyltransferase
MSTTLSPRASHDRRRDRGARSWLTPARRFPLVVVLVTMTFVIAGWSRRWTVDDAFIVFRVVDHVLSGHGPVFNVGERVEAVTSPLWLLVMITAGAVVPLPIEWLAVSVGLAFAAAGLVFAMAGAHLLSSRDGRLVPAGVLLWLGLPPAWDFATSGLESGLGLAWLGACCWGLARLARATPVDGRVTTPVGLAVLVGLGPVIRPDFGVFSVAFVVAVLLCADRDRRVWWRVVAAAVAMPGVVEIGRMGYYAALLPNTLLAKEASLSNWSQGWRYVVDFASPYGLVIPVGVLALLIVRMTRGDRQRGPRIVTLAFVVGGVVYSFAVLRGGGDFMHARLLLPALFAVLAPVALVRTCATGERVAVAVLACWAVLSAVALRPPVAVDGPGDGISDQRSFYVERAGDAHPVTLDDYRDYARVTRGARAARLAADGQRALIVDERIEPLATDAAPAVVYEAGAVGLAGAAAGEDVYVLDRLGLGDAYTARQRLETRRRPGHDKPLPMAWVWGRYGVMSAVPPDQATAARAARTAMACAPLRELDQAITQPLTARRFLDNLVAAPRLTMLRFPSEPQAAVDAVCGPNGRM